MKRLSLLRHAKSSWDDPAERDFDRPLNARGRRAAARIGALLAAEKLQFDSVLTSPAVRTLETVAGLEEALGRSLRAVADRRIYLASAATLMDLVRETPDTVDHLLLVGHNPGLEDLCLLASQGDGSTLREEAALKYPTATLATLAFPVRHWQDITEGGAELVRFVRPRDLDPSLGPCA